LNAAWVTPPSDNDEKQAQLEDAPFLLLVAGIFGNGISWVPAACSPAHWDKGQAGTIHSSAEKEESHPAIGTPPAQLTTKGRNTA
jgi:hypothetical protein